ncbi:MAG: hypothetical protein GWM92_15785 [Gemmatimonadetes bacterium]|nr:hypothetical protein [Gemmatimonadota bacterium]NIR80193.1 hypothetical protein [Gemmatimonadota bacterium]NIT88955.1 hypothetical protein [Gemmatimonadota bacterium]NIU32750.1 hypothetical protein [Gemmatimonadota bacterium]NIU37182.1 hypothetical protein [Gemmatimonadota bacterium]
MGSTPETRFQPPPHAGADEPGPVGATTLALIDAELRAIHSVRRTLRRLTGLRPYAPGNVTQELGSAAVSLARAERSYRRHLWELAGAHPAAARAVGLTSARGGP